jgi:hypothetical protein
MPAEELIDSIFGGGNGGTVYWKIEVIDEQA